MKFRLGLLLFWIWLVPLYGLEAQSESSTIEYGQTRSRIFEGVSQHTWTFNSNPLDTFEVRVQRISGQFTPRLSVTTSTGAALEPSITREDGVSQTFTFWHPIPAESYRIEVTGQNLQGASDNPDEYSLTLLYTGRYKPDPETGLSISRLGRPEFLPPSLPSGSPISGEGDSGKLLPLQVHGNVSATIPNRASPQNFILSGSGFEISDLANGNGMGRVLSSISFTSEGIGLVALPTKDDPPESQGMVFFTDQNIRRLENTASSLKVILADGTTISTDFYQVARIQAQEGVIALQTRAGNRIILDTNSLTLSRNQNQFSIQLEEGRIITSDLQGWHTLSYLDQGEGKQVDVLSGNNLRFSTTSSQLNIIQVVDETALLGRDDPLTSFSDAFLGDRRFLQFQTTQNRSVFTLITNRIGMGDIIQRDDSLEIQTLDSRIISDSVSRLSEVLIDQGRVLAKASDGTYRYILPNNLEIRTSVQPTRFNELALPTADDYVPSGYNNLGGNFLPNCACMAHFQADDLPVNAVNGNFYYAVQDFYIPSSTLSLDLKRHYNSRDPRPMPSYFAEQIANYQAKSFGPGWRHSYQVDLDLSAAPVGRVTMVLPDGSRHLFSERSTNESGQNILRGLFRSTTLPMWQLERLEGLLGAWRATRTDGLSYAFSFDGQLNDIRDWNGLHLSFSPAPLEYWEGEETGGLFIIEPYGRRQELYANAQGLIQRARDPESFQHRYRYNGAGELVEVRYYEEDQANYAYVNGLLSEVEDILSPYHAQMQITYDSNGRVESWTENPTGTSRNYLYAYDPAQKSATRDWTVNGELRQDRWVYDQLGRLVRRELPRSDWHYRYEYDGTNQNLAAFRSPIGNIMRFRYDDAGELTAVIDPIYADSGRTEINYTRLPDGFQRIVSEIRYGGGIGYDRFAYDENFRLISRAQRINAEANQEYITRYEIDEFGRLLAIFKPSPLGGETETRYSYDPFGYVQSIANRLQNIRYVYDRAGRLRSIQDGRGNQTRFNWDNKYNFLIETVAPLNYTLQYEYNPRGLLLRQTDRGAVSEYTYNDLEQMTTLTNPLGQITSYRYDEVGNPLEILLPDGFSTQRYEYDSLDKLKQAVSPSGLVETFEYVAERGTDGAQTGRLITRRVDSLRRSTEFTYDPLGRLRLVRLRDRNNRLIYEYAIETTSQNQFLKVERLSSAAGRKFETRYNLLGLPISTDVNGAVTRYIYNTAGYLAAVIDPSGRSTLYIQDELGNVIATSLPISASQADALLKDGSLTLEELPQAYFYEYDENSNLLSRSDPLGNTTTFVYDALNRLQTVTDPLGNLTTYGYDERSNLERITDPNGNVRTANYDEIDKLISISDNMNNTTSYEYDLLGRLTRVSRPRGLFEQYTYDADNNVVAITRPERRNDLYSYDAAQRLISFTDALGHTRIYTYDRLDRISAVIDPLGNADLYRWNSNQRLRTFRDSNDLSYEYIVDQLGRIERILDRNQSEIALNSQFKYDEAGNLLSVNQGSLQVLGSERANNHLYSYTPEGWLASYTDPEGRRWELAYDAGGNLVTVKDPRGIERQYQYDAGGRMIKITEAANTTNSTPTNYEYDANGNVSRMVEADGRITEFRYNGNNQLTQIIQGVGSDIEQSSLYDYDELGYLKSYTDPMGQRTEFVHNPFGNLQSVTRFLTTENGDSQTISYGYTYDAVGNLTGLALPEGVISSGEEGVQVSPEKDYRYNLTYNALDHPVRYVDPEDNVWAYSYDSEGHLLEVSDPLGSIIRYRYDVMGRIDQITYPDGAVVQLRYNAVGQLGSVQGAKTEVRTFTPNERVGSENVSISYTLDRVGNLLSFQDVDRSTTTFTYDRNGNLSSRRDALGNTINYSYDDLNRLTQVSSPEGTGNRTYNSHGQILSLKQGSFDYRYLYNSARQLTSRNENNLSLNYSYDLVGNLLREEAGQFGTTDYQYDSLYRATQIQSGNEGVSLSYNRNGWLTGITRSNGVSTSYSYNTNGAITLISHFGPSGVIEIYTYEYDSVGNITRINNSKDGSAILFSYDIAHQVINERWLSADNRLLYAVNYRYDEVGNRVEAIQTNIGTRDQSRTLYIYDRENQLIEELRNYVPPDEFEQSALGLLLLLAFFSLFSARLRRGSLALVMLVTVLWIPQSHAQDTYRIRYEYDANGSLTSISYPENIGGKLTLRYDAFNRLIQVTGISEQGIQVDTRYRYDPYNRIVEWQSLSGNYQLYYSGNDLIGMENRETGEQISMTLRLPSGVPLLISSNQRGEQWILGDKLNSARWLTDAAGNPIGENQRYSLSAFGEIITPAGADNALAIPSQPMPLYNGQLYDPTTELYLMGWRSYSPRLGRFIQRDPIRHDPNGSLYTYAYNRPYVFNDPSGLTPEDVLAQSRAEQLPKDILPPIIQQSLFTPQTQAASVADLQAAETARALILGMEIIYQVNEFPVMLDEQLGAFYRYGVDTISAEQRALRANLPQQILPLAANQWRPLPNASPSTAISPFAAWEDSAVLMGASQNIPLRWQNESPSESIQIPSVGLSPFDQRFSLESQIQTKIGEIPFLNGLYPQLQSVQQRSLSFPEALPSSPSIILPSAEANPVQVEALRQLREPHSNFYRHYLSSSE